MAAPRRHFPLVVMFTLVPAEQLLCLLKKLGFHKMDLTCIRIVSKTFSVFKDIVPPSSQLTAGVSSSGVISLPSVSEQDNWTVGVLLKVLQQRHTLPMQGLSLGPTLRRRDLSTILNHNQPDMVWSAAYYEHTCVDGASSREKRIPMSVISKIRASKLCDQSKWLLFCPQMERRK